MTGKPALILLLLTTIATAHVGSPDVFLEGTAGPYPLLVTLRPPVVIPGVAEVEIRTSAADVREIRVVPVPLTGLAKKYPPTPDLLQRSKADPRFYTGSVWLMTFGSWQVRAQVEGARGPGTLSVPIPAIASQTRPMQTPMAILLFGMMAFLVVGLVSIIGASVREAPLDAGLAPTGSRRRRANIVMALAAVLCILALCAGQHWWGSQDSDYRDNLYKPLGLAAHLTNGNRLDLHLRDQGWEGFRKLDDLVPDHNHLMHLFLVRTPAMDRLWHLHPDEVQPGEFSLALPNVDPGHYKIFADVVHDTGFAETAVTEIDLPAIQGRALDGDDSVGTAAALYQADISRTAAPLSDGFRMVWMRDSQPLQSRRLYRFLFRVEDRAGNLAPDMQLYMGMPGHAEFVRADGNVFAHVHPSGSVSMAALMMADGAMQSMNTPSTPPSTVSFPYGFPGPGIYRIFVQIKRNEHVDTGVFDAAVN